MREARISVESRVDVRDLALIVRYYNDNGKHPKSRAALLTLIVEDFASVIFKCTGLERPSSIGGARATLIRTGLLDDTTGRRIPVREYAQNLNLDLLTPNTDITEDAVNEVEDAVAKALQALEDTD
jgi:hypothetical protein